MVQTVKVGDRVTIKASRSIPKAIDGVVLAIDYGHPIHTPEIMLCVESKGVKLWVYAWRVES